MTVNINQYSGTKYRKRDALANAQAGKRISVKRMDSKLLNMVVALQIIIKLIIVIIELHLIFFDNI